jgi:hypothetical protein
VAGDPESRSWPGVDIGAIRSELEHKLLRPPEDAGAIPGAR